MCVHLLVLTFMSNVSFIQFHFSPKGRPHKKEFWLRHCKVCILHNNTNIITQLMKTTSIESCLLSVIQSFAPVHNNKI